MGACGTKPKPAREKEELETKTGRVTVHHYNKSCFAQIRLKDKISDEFLEKVDFGKLKPGGGKGGNLLVFSDDRQIVVKEIGGGDHTTLLQLAESYSQHVTDEENGTLMCKFYAHFYLCYEGKG